MQRKKTHREVGSVLVGVLMLGLAVTIMGAAVLLLAGHGSQSVTDAEAESHRTLAAEAGIRLSAEWLRTLASIPTYEIPDFYDTIPDILGTPDFNNVLNGVSVRVDFYRNDSNRAPNQHRYGKLISQTRPSLGDAAGLFPTIQCSLFVKDTNIFIYNCLTSTR